MVPDRVWRHLDRVPLEDVLQLAAGVQSRLMRDVPKMFAVVQSRVEVRRKGPALAGQRSVAPGEARSHSERVEIFTAGPDHETVALRAYELYLARGATDGHELDDWLAAERELRAQPTAAR
jgi:hypothetical protein